MERTDPIIDEPAADQMLLPGPDPKGEKGDVFDSFEIEIMAEYSDPSGGTYVEQYDEDNEDMIASFYSLYGHFSTGGRHHIADAPITTDEGVDRDAHDYITRLAGSIADGRPIKDYS